jgi:hypothetical protein
MWTGKPASDGARAQRRIIKKRWKKERHLKTALRSEHTRWPSTTSRRMDWQMQRRGEDGGMRRDDKSQVVEAVAVEGRLYGTE